MAVTGKGDHPIRSQIWAGNSVAQFYKNREGATALKSISIDFFFAAPAGEPPAEPPKRMSMGLGL